jgi:hypothetical protein
MKGRARVHMGRSMRLSLQDKKAVCGSLRRAWRQTRVAGCSPKGTPMPLLWPMDRRGGSGSQSCIQDDSAKNRQLQVARWLPTLT